MKKKLLYFVTLLVVFVLSVPNVQAAEDVSVTTEEELAACLGTTNSCVLANDITTNAVISLPDGATVTLDLAGHTIGFNENACWHFNRKWWKYYRKCYADNIPTKWFRYNNCWCSGGNHST